MTAPAVSIILCTRNRASMLRETLALIGGLNVPSHLPAELMVVDNGSTDDTVAVIKTANLPNMPVRYISEPRPGKSYAYNRALKEAHGRVLLCLDDDVHPPVEWIGLMCEPIVSGQADVVSGRVRMPAHLQRDWMQPVHLGTVACNEHLPAEMGFFGASMAFARHVLAKVPGFDPELGAGALGYGEEHLFGAQLHEAGFRFIFATPEATVEHHFDPSRLRRRTLSKAGVLKGREGAYLFHHWEHETLTGRRSKLLRAMAKLCVGYVLYCRSALKAEGLPPPLFRCWQQIGFYRQLAVEQCRPRNYARRGLVKLAGLLDPLLAEPRT